MSNATATRVVVAWQSGPSDISTLKMALALTELRGSLSSDRAVNRHMQAALDAAGTVDTEGKPVKALSNKRIGWYIAAAAEQGTDAAAFRAAYRSLASADRAAAADKRAAVTGDTSDSDATATGPVPQGNTVTVESILADIATLTTEDKARVLSALAAMALPVLTLAS